MRAGYFATILLLAVLGSGCAKAVHGTLGAGSGSGRDPASEAGANSNILKLSPGVVSATAPQLRAEMRIGAKAKVSKGPQLEARMGLSQTRIE